MSTRVKWITHKGKRIIFLDYTHLNPDHKKEFFKVLDEARNFILSAGNNLLILVDVNNSFTDSEIMQKIKEDAKIEKPQIKREAVVGITGIKAILLKAINMFSGQDIKPFSTIEEAKDWLTKE